MGGQREGGEERREEVKEAREGREENEGAPIEMMPSNKNPKWCYCYSFVITSPNP